MFEDAAGTGVRGEGSRGIAGVLVSNGRDLVPTDADGRYRIGVADGDVLFVVKPAHHATPMTADHRPRFYYFHRPTGSPRWHAPGVPGAERLAPTWFYPGSDPTGPLPASVDFPLVTRAEPDEFKVLVFGDTQVSHDRQLDWMARDTIAELVGVPGVAFGLSVGDLVNVGLLHLFEPLNQMQAKVGVPWYVIPGNHDQNLVTPDDYLADEQFRAVYGPTTYAFDYGPVSFLMLQNVRRQLFTHLQGNEPSDDAAGGGNADAEHPAHADARPAAATRPAAAATRPAAAAARAAARRRAKAAAVATTGPTDDPPPGVAKPAGDNYACGLRDDQWRFVENYLRTVPVDRPLVICMHIPLTGPSDEERAFARQFLGLIAGRPHTLSISGHTHVQRHTFHGPADGFAGPGEHHHFNTICVRGDGYRGMFDELRIPGCMAADGTPNGYSFVTFTRAGYAIRYKAARGPDDYQMNLFVPARLRPKALAGAVVQANVFAGSPRSTVRMRVNGGPWRAMVLTPQPDPAMTWVLESQAGPQPWLGSRYNRADVPDCHHLWQANLPADLPAGTHTVEVEAVDLFARADRATTLFRVLPA